MWASCQFPCSPQVLKTLPSPTNTNTKEDRDPRSTPGLQRQEHESRCQDGSGLSHTSSSRRADGLRAAPAQRAASAEREMEMQPSAVTASTPQSRARENARAGGAGSPGWGAEAAASGGAMSWAGGKRRPHVRVFSKVRTGPQRCFLNPRTLESGGKPTAQTLSYR